MNQIPQSIKVLSHSFRVLLATEEEFEDLLRRYPAAEDEDDKGAIIEIFDIKDGFIALRNSFDTVSVSYGLFHAIWEILLSLLGQYYNHEGFQGFSYVLFSVLKENSLSFILEEEECLKKIATNQLES